MNKRKKPTYDWDWFDTHAPFKKILEKTCELEINKEIVRYRFFGSVSSYNNYKIKLNYPMLKRNFEQIKQQILNTRICKHNQDVCDFVNAINISNPSNMCDLIIEGCISNASGNFYWEVNEDDK